MVRNEKFLLEKLLPVWKKYVDGFVFLVDTSDDGTYDFLVENSKEHNILEIIVQERDENTLWAVSEVRQTMYDAAKKYTNKIVCLDADEYFDGTMTKEELNNLLDSCQNTLFNLRWVQYTSANTIRVDGPWKNNYKGRVGIFNNDYSFTYHTMHATHLPIPEKQFMISEDKLFIAHLQWLDKNIVGIKQYWYKIEDYVSKKRFGADIVDKEAYDASVNSFEWEEEYYDYSLRVNEDIYEQVNNSQHYRLDIIKQKTKDFDIPNLGDWGLNIHDSVPMYFCTAADEKHYPILLNMIGSIHKYNFYDVVEIRVYDLGLNEAQKRELENIKKVKVCEIERTNSDILKDMETGINRRVKGLFSWKPVIIKDSLDHFPHVLYLDAGTTILRPLNSLFKHIKQNGYFFSDCGHSIKWMTTKYLIEKLQLDLEENKWLLDNDTFGIDAGFQGVSRELYDSYIMPMYDLAKEIRNFVDDGTCPDGWGTGRHDQTLFSILVKKLGYHVNPSKDNYANSMLTVDGKNIHFHLTHTDKTIEENTTVYRSRWNLNYYNYKNNLHYIKRKYIISVITGIGSLDEYEKFIDPYFNNIQQQVNFNRIEFIIVYSEWSKKFDEYKNLENVRFIKEDKKQGVYHAWNLGIINCSSEYVTNWNIDDLRFPINNKIKYDVLSKNTDIDLVYNWYVGVTEEELESDIDLNKKPIQQYPDDYHNYTNVACMAGPDPLWRKSFHTFGGYFNHTDYSVVGDWDMWIRMSRMGLKFKLVPHVLCIYVDHNNTVSKRGNRELEYQKEKLFKQYGIKK